MHCLNIIMRVLTHKKSNYIYRSMINLSDDEELLLPSAGKKRNKQGAEAHVRAPIAPIQEAIVQQTFRQTYC